MNRNRRPESSNEKKEMIKSIFNENYKIPLRIASIQVGLHMQHYEIFWNGD